MNLTHGRCNICKVERGSMTRFSSFTDDELDAMEEAFCNESLKYLVFEIRREKLLRIAEPQESEG